MNMSEAPGMRNQENTRGSEPLKPETLLFGQKELMDTDSVEENRCSYLQYNMENGLLLESMDSPAGGVFSNSPENYDQLAGLCLEMSDEGWNRENVRKYLELFASAAGKRKDFAREFIIHDRRISGHPKAIRLCLLYRAVTNILQATFTDITARGEKMRKALEISMYDPLTGAWNRRTIEMIVNRSTSSEQLRPFVMVDLDGFKALNDAMGHMAGDDILISVVKKLKDGLPCGAEIGRIGGDEFLIVMPECDSLCKAAQMAADINPLCRMNLPGGMRISASLGVAVCPGDGTDFNALYGKADIAMYAAKRRGGDGFLFYDSELENIGTRVNNEKFESIRDVRESVGDYTCVCDRAGHILRCSFLQLAFPEDKKGKILWDDMLLDGVCDEESAERIKNSFAALEKDRSISGEYKIKDIAGEEKWFRLCFVCSENDHVIVCFTDISSQVAHEEYTTGMRDYDELTGLFTRRAFCKAVNNALRRDPEGVNSGKYAMLSFNIARFKVINDMFGSEGGDRLLTMMGKNMREVAGRKGFGCRNGADRLYLFVQTDEKSAEEYARLILDSLADFAKPYTVTGQAGICYSTEKASAADVMMARAGLARSGLKNKLDQRMNVFSEGMRSSLLDEQELVAYFDKALNGNEFVNFYQPQYDHSTGMIVGAEALVRWFHPRHGMISPMVFCPLFEKNGLISMMDLKVFENTCAFLRSCLDKGLHTVPVSVNISRHDMFSENFIERMSELRGEYDIPANLIRIEITEGAMVGNNAQVNAVIKRFHELGFKVEMDDFGSGYSSLNVLKDMDLDVLKLDMAFLSGENSVRGGTILSSVIRMAKWMNLPVIAEGVETREQADFLRSVGCNYIQGYLYSKPLPAREFLKLISGPGAGVSTKYSEVTESIDMSKLWDPDSMETLLFSSVIGGAAILEEDDGKLEILRVNRQYLREMGMNLEEKDLVNLDSDTWMDGKNREVFHNALKHAAETGEETECETERLVVSKCCGEDRFYVRSNIRFVRKNGSAMVYYINVHNITERLEHYLSLEDTDHRIRYASEQTNMYYWEYDIPTRTMKPCFRCMRDLGLPAIVKNYPEPAIEMGIFPQDYADMYREWHRRLEKGEKSLEGVIPLTPDRVPFTVRYTTEFDENGFPVKAFGSAVPYKGQQ